MVTEPYSCVYANTYSSHDKNEACIASRRFKKKKSDDKDEEHEPDTQGLLGKLNDSIRNTYRVLDGSTSMEVLKGKECIDLLQDIEVVLMEFRKVI